MLQLARLERHDSIVDTVEIEYHGAYPIPQVLVVDNTAAEALAQINCSGLSLCEYGMAQRIREELQYVYSSSKYNASSLYVVVVV